MCYTLSSTELDYSQAANVYMQPMTATSEHANQPPEDPAIKALNKGQISCTLTFKLKSVVKLHSATTIGK